MHIICAHPYVGNTHSKKTEGLKKSIFFAFGVFQHEQPDQNNPYATPVCPPIQLEYEC